MSDDTARNQVNHAQVERGRQAPEHFEDTSPVAPAVKNIDRSVEFLDLVTACHAFVATAGRVVPGMRDRQLGEAQLLLRRRPGPRLSQTARYRRTRATQSRLAAVMRRHAPHMNGHV
jgi:hypothetical protein